MGEPFLRTCRFGVMTYVLMHALTSATAFVLTTFTDLYEEGQKCAPCPLPFGLPCPLPSVPLSHFLLPAALPPSALKGTQERNTRADSLNSLYPPLNWADLHTVEIDHIFGG